MRATGSATMHVSKWGDEITGKLDAALSRIVAEQHAQRNTGMHEYVQHEPRSAITQLAIGALLTMTLLPLHPLPPCLQLQPGQVDGQAQCQCAATAEPCGEEAPGKVEGGVCSLG